MKEFKEIIGKKLVTKIEEAVGVICDPYGTERAQREFTDILYKQTASRDDLLLDEKMAILQEYKLLLKKNKNRKNILWKAKEYLEENAEPQKIDNSWVFNFWDKAGMVTNDATQDLWARVLAQEVNLPDTISKRLMHNLSLMSSTDARNFENLVRFCFDVNDSGEAQPMIFIKEHARAYNGSNITTKMLQELEMFSLIEINYENGFAFNNKEISFNYKNRRISVTGEKIRVGNVRLTRDGQCLYKIVEKREKDTILEYIIEQLQYAGNVVTVDSK